MTRGRRQKAQDHNTIDDLQDLDKFDSYDQGDPNAAQVQDGPMEVIEVQQGRCKTAEAETDAYEKRTNESFGIKVDKLNSEALKSRWNP